MADQLEQKPFILGIDLGTNSVGWALIRLEDGKPAGIIRAGARVFDAGMEGSAKDFESGGEKSRNLDRRRMRHQRRQTWRRARRMKKIFGLLQKFGLLPEGRCATPEDRQNFINELDRTIRASPWFQKKHPVCSKQNSELTKDEREEAHRLSQLLPYILRASALSEKLEPYILGRALYNLAQRRGFQSNRKQVAGKKEEDEEKGKVKPAIKALESKIEEQEARTLGSLLSGASPLKERIRGPQRWTGREMFRNEFDEIWKAQSHFHPELLTEDKRNELFDKDYPRHDPRVGAVFYQRPLKIQTHLVGFCELEPNLRRAPIHLLSSQRFRLLQKVNDLRIELPDSGERPLTPEERDKLVRILQDEGNQTVSDVKSKGVLNLRGCTFTLERNREKTIPGNRTAASFRKALGEKWEDMGSEERNDLVAKVYDIDDDESLKKAAVEQWHFTPQEAERLAQIKFEAKYLNLSETAVERLLPLMEIGFSYGSLAPYYSHLSSQEFLAKLFSALEEGVPHAEACRMVFGDLPVPAEAPKDVLPPVVEAFREIRNPAVTRSLTELRKVVNAIVRRYDKPAEIRIELGRELKKPKKRRELISKRNDENRSERETARREITEETGDPYPGKTDIRKVLLRRECGDQCVYCGEQFSGSNFFSDDAPIEIDHIIPRSLHWDDSFLNLALCHAKCNREKGDNTPAQVFSDEVIEQIRDRIRRFSGNEKTKRERFRRFTLAGAELSAYLEEFSRRQLQDTAYASKLAKRYLGLLYGGEIDNLGKRRVTATSGMVTWDLRGGWDLNGILKDGRTSNGSTVVKTRDDHRHHAVDAVVIALTDDRSIQQLNKAAAMGQMQGKRGIIKLPSTWNNFVDTVRAEIGRIIVSHRVSKKVSGALHEETIYSPPIAERGPDGKPNGEAVPHVRKPLFAITKGEIENIADDAVRQRVIARLEELGGGDPKKLFATEANLPFLVTRDGRHIPIKKVRVRKQLSPLVLGAGRVARHVVTEVNHHLEVFAYLDEKGNEYEWDGAVVSMAEAYRRTYSKPPLPPVQRNHGPETQYKFSLSPGEIIQCDPDNKGNSKLLVVRSVSQFETGTVQIGLAEINDARKKSDMTKDRKFIRVVPNKLRQWNARKVAVSPLGEVSEAND